MNITVAVLTAWVEPDWIPGQGMWLADQRDVVRMWFHLSWLECWYAEVPL